MTLFGVHIGPLSYYSENIYMSYRVITLNTPLYDIKYMSYGTPGVPYDVFMVTFHPQCSGNVKFSD